MTGNDLLLSNFPLLLDNPDSISKLRKYILQLAVQGRLSEEWRKENPNVEPASVLLEKIKQEKVNLIEGGKLSREKLTSEIAEDDIPYTLPEGWDWCRLNTISTYIQRGKGPKYVELSECPVISQKCIQWNGFDISKARFIDPDSLLKYHKERHLQVGDLLWNSTGTGTIGRINMYPGDKHPIVVADSHVTVIRLLFVNSNYIHAYLSSPFIQNTIEETSSGSTNQIELNTTRVKLEPIPLPPLKEQHAIVGRIDALMKLCNELGYKQLLKDELGENLMNSLVHS